MTTVWTFEVGRANSTERVHHGTYEKLYKAFAAVRKWTGINDQYKRLPWEYDSYPEGPAWCLNSGDPEDPKATVPNPYRIYVTPRNG